MLVHFAVLSSPETLSGQLDLTSVISRMDKLGLAVQTGWGHLCLALYIDTYIYVCMYMYNYMYIHMYVHV